MKLERNPDDFNHVDEVIRGAYRVTTESTYAALVRTALAAKTPLEFVHRMNMAGAWLWPQLTPRTRPFYDEIGVLLEAIRAYVRTSSNRVWHPPMRVRVSKLAQKAEHAYKYTARRDRVMQLFEQADTSHRLEPLLKAKEAFSRAQSDRASKHRAFEDEYEAKRAAKAYHDIKEGRAAYGAVKALAARFEVTEATIRAVAKRYPPDSIDQ